MVKKKPESDFIDDPEDIPDLEEFDNKNRDKYKLIVFDNYLLTEI